MPRYATDLTGQRFTKLVVLRRAAFHPHQARWECRCDCGALRVVNGPNLLNGDTKSCGCFTKERLTKHGQSGNHATPEYRAWKAMKTRCLNPNQRWAKKWYRDVTICPEWLASFATFLHDVGPRPSSKHSLDRYPNPAGPYAPGNTRWATWKEQRANQRKPGGTS